MGGCSNDSCGDLTDVRYRKILWIILLLNAGMFFLEVFASFYSESVSLLADAGDFFADAANYGISLYVLNKALITRARASLIKGATMALMGVFVFANSIYHAMTSAIPQAGIMGAVGLLALIVNLGSAGLLYHYREGDSNRSSVWICSRNDAINNVMVILAAVGVTVTESHWPDIAVASLIALLFLRSASNIIKSALEEIKKPDSNGLILDSIITCPECGYQKNEIMPTNACQWYYDCEGCKALLKPKKGDCCVFCSYGTVKCPPIQQGDTCCN